jgi:PKHD-type hydroxylase
MQKHYTFDRNESHIDVNYTNYYWFKNGFTSEELLKIEKLTSNLKWETAATGQDDKSKISNYRKSKIKWCPQTDEWSWVYSKLHDMIVEANDSMWKLDLTTISEHIQYTEYYEGGGHYDWHMDCGIGIQNRRKVSVTVQLSDPSEYEGGNLDFNIGNKLTAPRIKGAAVVFPSFYLHRVTPVTKGTRKSFVLWVGGEPYR